MDLSGYSLTITCGNSRSAEEKSPVNQRVPPIWGEMVVCFSFRRMGIRELMPESEYKELHRAEIVDKVFTNLEKRSDSGIGQFRCMLKELTEWNYFDPYYFQKLNKLSESEAKRNISHLKQLQEIRDYKIKQERQRKEKA